MLAEGRITGIVPKSHLPNHNEFYERRWFSSGKHVQDQTIRIGDQEAPFGTDILFEINDTTVGVEICEDAWATITPSAYAALAGAEVIVNLSASNELVGKTNKRRRLIGGLAGQLICGYVYASAGKGESNADVIYGGHQMVAELGRLTADRAPHDKETKTLVYDIDRKYIQHDRAVNKTFGEQATDMQPDLNYRHVRLTAPRPQDDVLERSINAFPFVPTNPETLNERCEEIMSNLAEALAENIAYFNSRGIVLGLSGGLDSTLGVLIAIEAAKLLAKGPDFVHTITMPGPASSDLTQDTATALAKALGTTHTIKPISDLTFNMLDTIGHDQKTEDIAYENTQARMRTNILMDYANMIGGMTQGTGDMSEIMQGWCTFNGDHMSNFNPNAAVPKTLVRCLIQWYIDRMADQPTQKELRVSIALPVSPELVGSGDLSQTTESIIGPYELHDFFTYQHLRHGTRPQKIGYLATKAFAGAYDAGTIRHWLDSYYYRHTASQAKRESAPNSTQVGTVSGSQRGTLRMAPNTSRTWNK